MRLGYFAGRDFHLANLAVDSGISKSGVGWAVVGADVARGLSSKVLAVVRLKCARQIGLRGHSTARRGFGSVGRRAAYYSDPPDDAVLMECNIEIL